MSANPIAKSLASQYLGPTASQLVVLFLFIILNSVTLLALSIMLLRTVWSLATNVTTIESWEIERHETLLRRSRVFGGYLDGPDGSKIRVVKQEYPYDIGIWSNINQGMGGGCLSWLWPFAGAADVGSGLAFPVNGFEGTHSVYPDSALRHLTFILDPSVTWPPPDPDRMPRRPLHLDPAHAFTFATETSGPERLQAFRYRREQDQKRFQPEASFSHRRKPFHQRYPAGESNSTDASDQSANLEPDVGEEAWRNSEGDRLDDFGVDEEVEFYDEDNMPLSQLLLRRRTVVFEQELS